jgi:hypothetical protein
MKKHIGMEKIKKKKKKKEEGENKKQDRLFFSFFLFTLNTNGEPRDD